jgi:hypothetical protein
VGIRDGTRNLQDNRGVRGNRNIFHFVTSYLIFGSVFKRTHADFTVTTPVTQYSVGVAKGDRASLDAQDGVGMSWPRDDVPMYNTPVARVQDPMRLRMWSTLALGHVVPAPNVIFTHPNLLYVQYMQPGSYALAHCRAATQS